MGLVPKPHAKRRRHRIYLGKLLKQSATTRKESKGIFKKVYSIMIARQGVY
jgi:hypothetical protein